MMPYISTQLTTSLRREDLTRAERSRLRPGPVPGTGAQGVVDALGHRLISLGTRLVSDPKAHPTH